MFLYFENFVFFFCIFELLENICHTTRAAGQTLKGKENYYFFALSVTRCERPDRHNEVKENVFTFLDFFRFFAIFYNFQIYLFIFKNNKNK